MKKIFLVFSIFSIQQIFSQIISGDIYNVGRRLLTEPNFTLKGSKSGEVVFDISVDIYGKVTSAVVEKKMTTINSTPMIMDAKNMVIKYKFEPGNGFPKFHHGLIKIKFIEN
jgi:hypothetical protein